MSGLIDLVFPPRCGGCDRPGTLLCARCRGALPLIDSRAACAWCGAPLPGPPDHPHGRVLPQGASAARGCAECRGRAFAFSAARCAGLLEPPLSRVVVMLKDGGERRYAGVVAALLAETANGWLAPGDVLAPIPASPAAVRRRGFDHATDLSRSLARLTGNRAVRLLGATSSADQRALGRGARFANREQAYRLADAAGRAHGGMPERVVLVDDVFTTGASFDAAARVLRDAGARDVRALAVARSCRQA